MTTTESLADVVDASDKLRETIIGKIGEIDSKVDESRATQEQLSAASQATHEQFMTDADKRFVGIAGVQQTLRVDGDQNYWYPVVISQPDRGGFIIRREVHTDKSFYGLWNGSLEFHFRASDSQYGGAIGYISIDRYSVSGKSSPRLLPDSDIPFVGKISASHGPYDSVIWLRGNTTYFFHSDNMTIVPTVHYEEFNSAAGYLNPAPIPVTDGVDAGLPDIGYVRGE